MYQKILVPVDGSATSDRGLGEAIELAKLTGARLRLLHVVDELSLVTSVDGYAALSSDVLLLLKEGEQTILETAKARVEAGGLVVDTVLVEGLAARIADVVADQATAWGADLIVIGTHGRRGVGRLVLGSDAEQTVRVAPVPVLLVRARDAAAQALSSHSAALTRDPLPVA